MATRAGVEACGAVVVGGAVDAVVEGAVDPVVTGTDLSVGGVGAAVRGRATAGKQCGDCQHSAERSCPGQPHVARLTPTRNGPAFGGLVGSVSSESQPPRLVQ